MAKEQYPETIVGSSMKIEGELKSAGNIKIDGTVSGKVQTSQDLSIGPNASVEADLIAQNAIIAGVVKGNVTVKDSLTILASGKIIGNIICTGLAIAAGAYFSGNCRMQEIKHVEVQGE